MTKYPIARISLPIFLALACLAPLGAAHASEVTGTLSSSGGVVVTSSSPGGSVASGTVSGGVNSNTLSGTVVGSSNGGGGGSGGRASGGTASGNTTTSAGQVLGASSVLAQAPGLPNTGELPESAAPGSGTRFSLARIIVLSFAGLAGLLSFVAARLKFL